MQRLVAALLALFAPPALSDDAGDFDYYVLSLSWSANWCATEGDARGSDQCDPRHDHGWILHGLWPQFENGYPEYCATPHSPPSRSQTRAMADIMGSSGLAWHQWKKHGSCSGLNANDYFSQSRKAFAAVQRPEILRKLKDPVRINPAVIEAAFIEANPDLRPDGITITCKANHIQEARICLTKDMTPRHCGRDVRKDCTTPALFMPMR